VTFQIYFFRGCREVCILSYFDYFSLIDGNACFNNTSSDTDFGIIEDCVDWQASTFSELSLSNLLYIHHATSLKKSRSVTIPTNFSFSNTGRVPTPFSNMIIAASPASTLRSTITTSPVAVSIAGVCKT